MKGEEKQTKVAMSAIYSQTLFVHSLDRKISATNIFGCRQYPTNAYIPSFFPFDFITLLDLKLPTETKHHLFNIEGSYKEGVWIFLADLKPRFGHFLLQKYSLKIPKNQ